MKTPVHRALRVCAFKAEEKWAFESPPPPTPPPRIARERQGLILLISSVVMFLLNKTLMLSGTRE